MRGRATRAARARRGEGGHPAAAVERRSARRPSCSSRAPRRCSPSVRSRLLRDFLRAEDPAPRGDRPRGRRLPPRRAAHPREPVAVRRAAAHPGRRRREVRPTRSSSTRSRTSSSPPTAPTLVLRHAGGVRGKKLLDAIRARHRRRHRDRLRRAQAGRREADFAAPSSGRRAQRSAPGALRALVAAFADDLAELAAACQQLIADAPRRDHRGRRRALLRRPGRDQRVRGRGCRDRRPPRRGAHRRCGTRSHRRRPGADRRRVRHEDAHDGEGRRASRSVRPQLAAALGLAPWQVDRARRDLAGWTDEGLGTGDRGARRDRRRRSRAPGATRSSRSSG